ncbi:hypothetical protein [Dactylosporangium sp. NPDC000521]|uniref:hypothetical protein n=1 Tax=Dactylosporangium sp. NPDC000521 TaxID=3363975 RepID=UPI0036C8A6E1
MALDTYRRRQCTKTGPSVTTGRPPDNATASTTAPIAATTAAAVEAAVKPSSGRPGAEAGCRQYETRQHRTEGLRVRLDPGQHRETGGGQGERDQHHRPGAEALQAPAGQVRRDDRGEGDRQDQHPGAQRGVAEAVLQQHRRAEEPADEQAGRHQHDGVAGDDRPAAQQPGGQQRRPRGALNGGVRQAEHRGARSGPTCPRPG